MYLQYPSKSHVVIVDRKGRRKHEEKNYLEFIITLDEICCTRIRY